MSVRLFFNLVRLYPEMVRPQAAELPLPASLAAAAAPGPCEVATSVHPWGVAAVPLGVSRVPVILFSGGAAADGTGYANLMNHWASHGFAVLHVVHDDAYEAHLARWRHHAFTARASCTFAVWRLAMGHREPWRSRVADFAGLLDRLDELDLRIALDHDRIGAGGYCYGGAVALLSGGANLWHQGQSHRWHDPRVKAVLALTPDWGARRPPDRVWRNLKVPMMTITGDGDRDVQGRDWRMKALPFHHGPGGAKYLAHLRGGNHFTFSGRLYEACLNTPQELAQTHLFAAVKALTLLFWQAQLNGDVSASATLVQLQPNELLKLWRK